MAEPTNAVETDAFSLRRRVAGGGTAALSYWTLRNETDPLTDVLLGSPEHLFHRATLIITVNVHFSTKIALCIFSTLELSFKN